MPCSDPGLMFVLLLLSREPRLGDWCSSKKKECRQWKLGRADRECVFDYFIVQIAFRPCESLGEGTDDRHGDCCSKVSFCREVQPRNVSPYLQE
jgi:hypothetical protein